MGFNINSGYKLQIKPKEIMSYLPGAFYLANLIRLLGSNTAYYTISIVLVGGIGLVSAIITKKYRMTQLWLFAVLYLFTLVTSWLIIGNIAVDSILSTALLIGISFLLVLYPWGYKYGNIVFYLSALLLLYRMNGAATRRILTSSSNYISVMILLAVFFYYISIENDDRQLRLIDILPAFLCLSISVWAEGRGGILSCTFLLVLILLCYVKTITNKNAKRTIVMVIVAFLAGVIMYYKNFNLIDTFMGLGKWGTRGSDNSARIYIWMSYFSKVKESALYLFFGAPLNKISIIAAHGENTHNSFIQLHAYNGLIMLIAIAIYIVKSCLYFYRQKNYITLIMMITIIIRGLSDKFIFGQYGMPIMVYFVLLPYIAKQKPSEVLPGAIISREVLK